MAKTRTRKALAAGAVALSVLAVSGRAAAAPGAVRTVVLHVSDLAGVSARNRVEAENRATLVYERIGVRIDWMNGPAADAPADGALHLDIVILPGDMADRKNGDGTAFGQANRLSRHAYIYYARIEAYAVHTRGNPACLLAVVLAHEIGHLLLPEHSHSRSGLMRAEWKGRIVDVPDFDRRQGEMIRAELTPPHSDTIGIAATDNESGTAESDQRY